MFSKHNLVCYFPSNKTKYRKYGLTFFIMSLTDIDFLYKMYVFINYVETFSRKNKLFLILSKNFAD